MHEGRRMAVSEVYQWHSKVDPQNEVEKIHSEEKRPFAGRFYCVRTFCCIGIFFCCIQIGKNTAMICMAWLCLGEDNQRPAWAVFLCMKAACVFWA